MKYFFTGLSVLCFSTALQAQLVNNGGTVVFSNGVAVQVNNSLQNQAGGTLQNNGTVTVTGNISNTGTVKGNGTIGSPADITNFTGTVSPGNDNVGQLNITGNFNNGVGILAIEIGGPVAGTGYDRLAVSDAVSAAGTLNVNVINAYSPPPGTTFDVITGTSVSGTFGTLNLPSGWTVVYLSDKVQVKSPVPLPVFLEYFTGAARNSGNQLDWKVNYSGPGTAILQLEHSSDGKDFTRLYQTETDAGRSVTPFTYEDKTPFAGVNYYRLKMTDEGKTNYSHMVTLNSKQEALQVLSLAPNPVMKDGTAVLQLSALQQGKLKIWIIDAAGRKMTEQNQDIAAGMNTINLRGLSMLAPGIYQVSLLTGDGMVRQLKFSKQ